MFSIESPITGAIATMYCDDGASVDEGELLAQVECMKTFFDIRAPASGTLHWTVQPGSQVSESEIIGEIHNG